jgi:hypothetical protein
MTKAEEVANQLLNVGRQMNDPRSTGYGMVLRTLVALACADYRATLSLGEAERRTASALNPIKLKAIKSPGNE